MGVAKELQPICAQKHNSFAHNLGTKENFFKEI